MTSVRPARRLGVKSSTGKPSTICSQVVCFRHIAYTHRITDVIQSPLTYTSLRRLRDIMPAVTALLNLYFRVYGFS